jgi:hypothetical protein
VPQIDHVEAWPERSLVVSLAGEFGDAAVVRCLNPARSLHPLREPHLEQGALPDLVALSG